jgi:hypothetical protein
MDFGCESTGLEEQTSYFPVSINAENFLISRISVDFTGKFCSKELVCFKGSYGRKPGHFLLSWNST